MTAAILPAAGNPAIQSTEPPGRQRFPAMVREAVWLLAGAALLVASWALLAAAGVLGPSFIGPDVALGALVEQWGIIWYNAEPTLTAAVTGAGVLLIVTALGLVLIGMAPWLSPLLVSVSIVVGSLPLISATPVLSILIPRGTSLIAVVTVLSGLVPVAAMLGSAAHATQIGRADLGELYSASAFRWWRYVGLGRTVPVVDIGLRAMLPACFVGAIVAEWSGAAGERGLGGLMANAMYSYQAPLLWAAMVLAAGVAVGLLAVVALIMMPIRRALQ
jgi:ABC-type nitrate/sulfonate/bicarbonate transport system permease component